MTADRPSEVRVFAPATVANVACGYDVLGIAIEAPGDEVVARWTDEPGLHIAKITGDDGKLPLEVEQNTAGVAALDLLKHLGRTDVGIELEIHKKMPFGSGLGSSAASAVAPSGPHRPRPTEARHRSIPDSSRFQGCPATQRRDRP